MLTLTPTAATALSAVRSESGAPDSHGVRFFAMASEPAEQPKLAFGFVEAPEPGDTVTETDGLRTYVAPEVDAIVGDAIVDLESDGRQSSLVLRRSTPGDGRPA